MLEKLLIREATTNDLDMLLKLEQAIINAERPFDPTIRTGEVHYYDLAEMIANPSTHLVVGEYKNEIIASGYAKVKEAKPYLRHQQHAYLGFMYVHPDYRGKGVIQKVIDNLKEWAAAQGLTEMRLEVYSKNETAIKAYEKAGFEKHMIEMRMGL